MSMVVDASVVLRLLAGQERDDLLRKRFEKMRSMHAPHLIDAEVANGIRGLCLGGKIDSPRLYDALRDYRGLPIVRHEISALIERALDFRDDLSAYDASYLALAEAMDAELVTCDEALAKTLGPYIQVHHYT